MFVDGYDWKPGEVTHYADKVTYEIDTRAFFRDISALVNYLRLPQTARTFVWPTTNATLAKVGI